MAGIMNYTSSGDALPDSSSRLLRSVPRHRWFHLEFEAFHQRLKDYRLSCHLSPRADCDGLPSPCASALLHISISNNRVSHIDGKCGVMPHFCFPYPLPNLEGRAYTLYQAKSLAIT